MAHEGFIMNRRRFIRNAAGLLVPGLGLAVLPAFAQTPFQRALMIAATQGGGGGAVVIPTIFDQDAFTGSAATALTSHTPDIGGSWTHDGNWGSGTPKLDGSGGIYGITTGGDIDDCRCDGVANSANCYAETVLNFITALASVENYVGIGLGNNASALYTAFWEPGAARFALYKGYPQQTELGSYSDTFTSGTKTLRLTRNAGTVSVQIGGTTRITVSDTTYTAINKVFVFIKTPLAQTSVTGIHPTAFVASTI